MRIAIGGIKKATCGQTLDLVSMVRELQEQALDQNRTPTYGRTLNIQHGTRLIVTQLMPSVLQEKIL